SQTNLLPIATFGDYGGSSGTGNLDALVYTFTGASNSSVGLNGNINLADPTKNPSGNLPTFQGTWPDPTAKVIEDRTQVVGPTGNPDSSQDGLLDYLHSFNPLFNTPVLGLDMNQTGNSNSLQVGVDLKICSDAACSPGKVLADIPLDTIT